MAPLLTLVVTSLHPGSELAACLESIAPQVEEGVRVLVATADPSYRPPAAWVDRLALPGADVFTLRAAGAAAATTPLVAVTEDHCRIDPGWAAHVLATFAANPWMEAVTGPCRNGATATVAERANYWTIFGTHAPGPGFLARGGPTITNLAWRRGSESPPDAAAFHATFMTRLRTGACGLVPAATVVHDQRLGLRQAVRNHYHNARATHGYERQRTGPPDGRRKRWLAGQPFARLADVLGTVRRAEGRVEALRLAGAVAVLCAAAGWGAWRGERSGPGRSPAGVP